MSAQFYGSVSAATDERYEFNGGRFDDNPEHANPEQYVNQQEYQSAMLFFQEINNDVKKMRSEMAVLKEDVEQFRASNGSVSKSKSNNKLPDGLSVSCNCEFVALTCELLCTSTVHATVCTYRFNATTLTDMKLKRDCVYAILLWLG